MSCLLIIRRLVKFGQKIRKIGSKLKHISNNEYCKMKEPEFDISALVNEFDLLNDKMTTNCCGEDSKFKECSQTSAMSSHNLKIPDKDENFEIMMRDFKSMQVEHDYVPVPPRDPWEDLTTFADKNQTGFEENMFLQPLTQISGEFATATCSDYGSSSYSYAFNSYTYSPLSNSESNLNVNETTASIQGGNIMTFGYEAVPELSASELNEHFNKTKLMTAFSPAVASTPLAQRQLDYLLYSDMEVTNIIDNWNSFLTLQESYQRIGCNMGDVNFNINYGPNDAKPIESMHTEVKRKPKIKPHKKSMDDHCVFCKNNGESEAVYRSHTVKDAKGRVLCPKLRVYKCQICGVDGDMAHTVKYCPYKKIFDYEDMHRYDETLKSKQSAKI